MDPDDEQPLRSRVYGADHDHPGPLPSRDYAELVGGPLDGLLLDITGRTAHEIQTGVALMTERGQFDPGGRALCDARPGERNRRDWSGDSSEASPSAASRRPVEAVLTDEAAKRVVHKFSDALVLTRVCLSVIICAACE
jgi:hypothetical protein